MTSTMNVRPVSIEDLFAIPAGTPVGSPIRGEAAWILLCSVPGLGHTSVIVCAPLNTYLAAVREYPAFSFALHAYTQKNLVPNGSFYKRMLALARECGVKKDYFPRVWFLPYAQWGAYGEDVEYSPIGKKSHLSFQNQCRLHSTLVADAAVEHVVAHWQKQFAQFGSKCFWPASEDLNSIVGGLGFSETPDHSSIPYESPDRDVLSGHVFLNPQREEAVMQRLREIADAAERGIGVQLRLFPLHAVKLAPSCMAWVHAGPSDLSWERLLLRSRLAKHLAWPWHHWSLVSDIERLEKSLEELSDVRRFIVEEALANLKEYRRIVETSFPVILENPLRDVAETNR